jgi:hypothetical protein
MKEAHDDGVDPLPHSPNDEPDPAPKYHPIEKIGRPDVPPVRREFYDGVLQKDPDFPASQDSEQQDNQHDPSA